MRVQPKWVCVCVCICGNAVKIFYSMPLKALGTVIVRTLKEHWSKKIKEKENYKDIRNEIFLFRFFFILFILKQNKLMIFFYSVSFCFFFRFYFRTQNKCKIETNEFLRGKMGLYGLPAMRKVFWISFLTFSFSLDSSWIGQQFVQSTTEMKWNEMNERK